MSTRKRGKSGGQSARQLSHSSEVVVPVEIHSLAISQARAFANLARSIHVGTHDQANHGELLGYLVNAGLSIELYLKALMISARGGKVTMGHDLGALYKEFPDFLRDFLEFTYASHRPSEGWTLTLHALKFSDVKPAVPSAHPSPRFNTFADTLNMAKDSFVRARYFFEKVNAIDWEIFAYAPLPLNAAMMALDAAYEHHLAGSFGAGKDMIAERNANPISSAIP